MKSKRILALILSVCMIASALGMPVFAAGDDDISVPESAAEVLTDVDAGAEAETETEAEPPVEETEDATESGSEAIPEEQTDVADMSSNRFEGLTGEQILKVFNQTSEGLASLLSGITEEEWTTINSILTDDEKAVLDSIISVDGGGAPQQITSPK